MAVKEVDLKQIGQVYNKILRKMFFSIYRRDYQEAWKRKTIRFAYVAFLFITPFSFFSSQISSWFFMTKYSEKMLSMALIFNISCIMIRVITFCSTADQLESLYLDFEQFHCNQHRPLEAKKQLNITYRRILKIDYRASMFFLFNVVNWYIVPVIFNRELFNLITGNHFDYDKWTSEWPYLIFIKVKSPWKEIRYVWEVFVAAVVNPLWVATDMVYVAIIMLLETQYTLLGQCLLTDNTVQVGCKQPINYEHFVEDHNKLLKTCRTLEHQLRPIVSSILITTGVLIGANLLIMNSGLDNKSAGIGEMTAFYSQFVGYLLMALLELFIFCLLSEKINTASLNIADTIYESEWYCKLGREERNLVLSLKIAQKGANITAFKLVKINLNTFMEVLRLSYSFFTVMKEGNKSGAQRDISIL